MTRLSRTTTVVGMVLLFASCSHPPTPQAIRSEDPASIGAGMIPLRQVPLRWWPRRARSAIRDWWLWQHQGRPTTTPVVVRQGRLVANQEGRGLITDWDFSFRYMPGQIHVDDLWDRLSGLYPVERREF